MSTTTKEDLLHEAFSLYQKRKSEELPGVDDLIPGCCPEGINKFKWLHVAHCQSIAHISTLKGVDPTSLIELFKVYENGTERLTGEYDEKRTGLHINDGDASGGAREIVLQTPQYKSNQAYTLVKIDLTDNPIDVVWNSEKKPDKSFKVSLTKPFQMESFVTLDDEWMPQEKFLQEKNKGKSKK